MSDGGAEERVGNSTIFGIAALDSGDAGGVSVIFGGHAADDAKAMHLFGAVWHEFAEVNAWN